MYFEHELKLNQQNEISFLIHEEKMYGRNEVIKLCKSAFTTGTKCDVDYFEWEKQNLK